MCLIRKGLLGLQAPLEPASSDAGTIHVPMIATTSRLFIWTEALAELGLNAFVLHKRKAAGTTNGIAGSERSEGNDEK